MNKQTSEYQTVLPWTPEIVESATVPSPSIRRDAIEFAVVLIGREIRKCAAYESAYQAGVRGLDPIERTHERYVEYTAYKAELEGMLEETK